MSKTAHPNQFGGNSGQINAVQIPKAIPSSNLSTIDLLIKWLNCYFLVLNRWLKAVGFYVAGKFYVQKTNDQISGGCLFHIKKGEN